MWHANIKPYFLQKIKVKKIKCCLLQFLFGVLKVKPVLVMLLFLLLAGKLN